MSTAGAPGATLTAPQPAVAVAPARRAAEWKLALPLAVLMAAFFVAPLAVLVAMSLHADGDARALTLAQYVKFLGETFNLRILGDTMWLGAKATLVSLLF